MTHAAILGPARERTMHVVQGEYRVINDPRVVLTTILGSCVATCIWDEVAGVGGMNHFLLPGDDGAASDQVKYGVNAMELLINGLLKAGASRARMRAKLFGGAHVVQSLGDIGAKNAAFAQRFLALEGISCVGQSMGGDRARRVRFWPTSGRASQLLLEATQAKELLAERQLQPTPVDPSAGKVELF
jgi:chemotaxis protein CheD